MKIYKLTKDIPMFKKGDLFFIHPEQGCLIQKDTLRLAYHKETIDKNPEILNDWFEEISKNKRCRADYGSEYYYVNDFGYVDKGEDYRDIEDDLRYRIGNYELTEEEAEVKLKYDTARQTLLDDADGGKWVQGDSNWSVFYGGTIFVITNSTYYKPGIIYFQNIEALKSSLKKHKKQWKIVRKYEMGEYEKS
jgi:hypothetical protein